MINFVTKRNGAQQPYEVSKIRFAINEACQGLDIDTLALEAKVSNNFSDGVTTTQIQEYLVETAKQLITVEEPDWSKAAGRLAIMDLWKNVINFRGYGYDDYFKHLSLMTDEKYLHSHAGTVEGTELTYYDPKILQLYTVEEIVEAASWIVRDRDLDFDLAGVVSLSKRYLVKCKGNKNKALLELPQEAFLTIALLLASVEAPQNRMKFAKEVYEAVSLRKLSLATPVLANLRVPNGSLSSCFTDSTGDSLKSISKGWTNAAEISKKGGGLGKNLSKVRALGSTIKGIPGLSGGVLPWVKVLNGIANSCNQSGVRAGSFTIALAVWHLDIESFISCQDITTEERLRSDDIFPQILVHDEFVRRVKAKTDWTLIDPKEVEDRLGIKIAECYGARFEAAYKIIEDNLDKLTLYKKVPALNILSLILKKWLETGKPYIAFIDTINEFNTCPHIGNIEQVNLCVESYSPTITDYLSHCCNLLSINLANVDLLGIAEMAPLAVRILDNAIDLTVAPTVETARHNEYFRTLGVGLLGMADRLALSNLNYTSHETKKMVADYCEEIAYWSYKESAAIAQEKGNFKTFQGSEQSKGILLGKVFCGNSYVLKSEFLDFFNYTEQQLLDVMANQGELIAHFDELIIAGLNKVANHDWQALAQEAKSGFRNAVINNIPPNTGTSLIQGATASFLPVYNKLFVDKVSDGGKTIVPPYLKEKFWFYQEQIHINPTVIIDLVSEAIQPWLD